MRLDRKTKARIVAFLNPKRLLPMVSVLWVLCIVWFMVALVSVMLDFWFPTPLAGLIPMAILPVIWFRIWAGKQGWDPVRSPDLDTLPALFPDPLRGENQSRRVPQALQEALAQTVQRQGWVSWQEVMDLAHSKGVPMALTMGGLGWWRGPVARRGDWKEVLSESAWQSALMERAFSKIPAAPTPSVPSRGRL